MPLRLDTTLARTWRLFRPPPRLTVDEWADAHRYLARGTSAEAGKYRADRLPYQREPQRAITDPNNGATVLLWSKQTGKTETLLNAIGYFIDANPSPILVVYPTLDAAKAFSRKKLARMIAETPCLRDKVRDPRARDSRNTVLSKEFPGGDITIAGANSSATLRSQSRRVVIQDEIDDFPLSTGTEGDPCLLADGRAENYHDAVFIKASTPTIKGASRIEAEFDQTDKRFWFCPCPRCGGFQTLKWPRVKWPDNKPEEATYRCEHCNADLADNERVQMVLKGEWRATEPHRRKRGYHLSGLYRIMGKKRSFATYLHEFAAGFLDAQRKGSEGMRMWTNTFLAESYEPPAEKLETVALMDRIEEYGGDNDIDPIVPKYAIILTAAVDVQANRLELLVEGWGARDECWAVETRRIAGDPAREDVWNTLDDLLNRSYRHELGGAMKIERCCIDTGYKTDEVCEFVRKRQPRLVAIKGSNKPGAMLFQVGRANKRGVRLYLIGTDTAKDTLFSRLKIDTPGPRYVHFPRGFGFNKDFFEQLTSEQIRTVFVKGFPRREWHLPDGVRNEALDLKVYSFAAWEIHKYHTRPNLERVAEQLAVTSKTEPPKVYDLKDDAAEPDKPAEKPVKPARSFPRHRGGFVGGWK